MSNYDLEELNSLNWQLTLSLLFIINILISLTLTYNQILKRKKQTPLYSDDEEQNVLKFNRTLAVGIALGFLLINVKDKKNIDLQISASTLTLISTIIVLYTAFYSKDSNLYENPEI